MSKCPHCNGTGVRPEHITISNGKCFPCNGTGVAKGYEGTPEAAMHRFRFSNDIRLIVRIRTDGLVDLSISDPSIEDNLHKHQQMYNLTLVAARTCYSDMSKEYGKPLQY